MNPRKITAIGITTLFLALVVIPVQGTISKEHETLFPIQLSTVQADGSIGSQIISLTKDQVIELSNLIKRFSYTKNWNEIIYALKGFFKRHNIGTYDPLSKPGIFDILPGCPILSIGEGPEILTRYHGRVQFKKLISTWHYPKNGFTMIFGNEVSPKQILFQRQMGFMIGFVGIYLHVPKVLENQKAGITCMIGSSLFAWGTSF
jgi:hypothetical protein